MKCTFSNNRQQFKQQSAPEQTAGGDAAGVHMAEGCGCQSASTGTVDPSPPAAVTVEAAEGTESMEAVPVPITPNVVKNRVLTNANPEMIARLNSMLMSPSATPFSPSFAAARKEPSTPSAHPAQSTPHTTQGTAAATPNDAPRSVKSKFLQRYVSTPLSEHKVEVTAESFRSPLSFLDQIKNKSNNTPAKMSFLDQIKSSNSKRSECSTENDENSSMISNTRLGTSGSSQGTPLADHNNDALKSVTVGRLLSPPGGGLSFLESIRAARKVEDAVC